MRAVITRTRARHQLGRPRALQAVARPCSAIVAMEAVRPARRSRPGSASTGPRRPRRSGKIPARAPSPAAAPAASARRQRISRSSTSFADSRNPHARTGPTRPPAPPAPQRWRATPALRDAFVELHGPLGAGKTTFVRHLLRALGVHGPHQEPDLRGDGALRAAAAATRLALRLLPLRRPARVGRRRLSRRLRSARPEAGRVAREGRRRCCRCPTCACTSSRVDDDTRDVRVRRLHAARRWSCCA